MPVKAETVRLGMLVTPTWDERAAKRMVGNATELFKQLSKMKVEWAGVTKQADINLKNIKDITTAAEYFGKALSTGAKESFKHLRILGDELEGLTQEAEGLQTQLKIAKTAAARKTAAVELNKVTKRISNLNQEIADHSKTQNKYGAELRGSIAELTKFKDFKVSDTVKSIFSALGSGLARGGPGGLRAAIGGAGVAAGKGVRGAAARQVAAGEMGTLAQIAPMLAKLAPIFAIAAAGITMFFKAIIGATEQTANLNKALIAGLGTANDFIASSESYRGAVDDIRNAIIKGGWEMRKYGFDAQKTAEVINAFTATSTGSIIKMRNTFAILGKKDIKKGVNEFVINAIAYGKALGMEAKDTAAMMGEFVSEVGYGAKGIQDSLADVVRAAAGANIPMTKFMGIFRQVLPDVELYRNRLEELTGVIRLLSKTMSPSDVKKFMDAFAKGFKAVDFKQRYKTVEMAGAEFTAETLGRGFKMGAINIGKQLEEALGGAWGKRFKEAYGKGPGAVAELIADAQIEASQEGIQLQGKLVQQMMELSEYAKAAATDPRRPDWKLQLASALKGAGVTSTYLILRKMSEFAGKGFTGLIDHIRDLQGISVDHKEMLMKMVHGMMAQQSVLRRTGMTADKKFNEGLIKAIAVTSKGVSEQDVTMKMMQNATEEQIMYAAEYAAQAKESNKVEITAQSLAQEQVNFTKSILERIDNVLSYLLERIYQVIDGVIGDTISKLWSWLVGDDTERKQLKYLEQVNAGIQASGWTEFRKFQFSVVTEDISKGVSKGLEKHDLAKRVFETPAFEGLAQLGPKTFERLVKERGVGYRERLVVGAKEAKVRREKIDPEQLIKEFQAMHWETLKIADPEERMKATQKLWSEHLGYIQGDMSNLLQEVGHDLLFIPVEEKGRMEELYASKTRYERNDSDRREQITDEQRKAEAEVSDITAISLMDAADAGRKAWEYIKKKHDKGDELLRKKKEAQIKEEGEKIKKTIPGPAGPVAPAAAGLVRPQAKVTEKQTGEIVATTESTSDEVIDAIDDIGIDMADVAGLLRTGIVLEDSFMSGIFRRTIAAATLESLRTALFEHVVMIAKILPDASEFGTALAERGKDILGKFTMAELAEAPTTGVGEWLKKREEERRGEKQAGGYIPEGGIYKLHRGERVLSTAETAAMERGGGTKIFNMTINGASMSIQEMRSVAIATFEGMARRS